jgi:hypothetical protein
MKTLANPGIGLICVPQSRLWKDSARGALRDTDRVGEERGVRNQDAFVLASERGVAQVDLAHRSLEAGDGDAVMPAEGPVDEDQGARHHVGENVAQGEAEREASEPQAGDERGDVDAGRAEKRGRATSASGGSSLPLPSIPSMGGGAGTMPETVAGGEV